MFSPIHHQQIRTALAILARALEAESGPVGAAEQAVQSTSAVAETSPEPAIQPVTPTPVATEAVPLASVVATAEPNAHTGPAQAFIGETSSQQTAVIAQPTSPTAPTIQLDAAAGGYFQAIFGARGDVDESSAMPPPRPELEPAAPLAVSAPPRNEAASAFFSALPWRAPAPINAAEPVGLGAAIMVAATRSALQSASRMAQTQAPPVPASAYFQNLPWANQTPSGATMPHPEPNQSRAASP